MDRVPDHLASTFRMLEAAFSDGIAAPDYLPLLAVLTEAMSDRNVADVMSRLVDRSWPEIYNDVLAAQAAAIGPEANRIKAQLKLFGYDAWLQED